MKADYNALQVKYLELEKKYRICRHEYSIAVSLRDLARKELKQKEDEWRKKTRGRRVYEHHMDNRRNDHSIVKRGKESNARFK